MRTRPSVRAPVLASRCVPRQAKHRRRFWQTSSAPGGKRGRAFERIGNMIESRDYQSSDLESLKRLITELQTFEQQFDAGRTEPTREFISHYVSHLLNNVEEQQGSILVAAAGDQVCGLVAGYPE